MSGNRLYLVRKPWFPMIFPLLIHRGQQVGLPVMPFTGMSFSEGYTSALQISQKLLGKSMRETSP